MTRLVLAPLALVAALALAAPAPAVTPTERKLLSDVKVMKKQIKTLQKQVSQARTLAAAAIVYSGCSTAVTVDALQGTWAVIDDVSNKTTAPKTWFGAQAPANDFQTCSALQITRAPTQVPPNATVFNSLLALLR
jgi:hypothetical protein